MVPGGGIEPPTRGFSIRCSTPELPGRAIWGSGYLTKAFRLVHADFSAVSVFCIRRRFPAVWRIIGVLDRSAGNSIGAVQPAAEIGVRTPFRAEGAIVGEHRMLAAARTFRLAEAVRHWLAHGTALTSAVYASPGRTARRAPYFSASCPGASRPLADSQP